MSQSAFSSDYASSRQRFRQLASQLNWRLESLPIGLSAPDAGELSIDVACSQTGDSEKVLILSSGLHGVEGFLGSAVQIDLFELWASETPPLIKCVFLHGLNPYGFAFLRRFDENNVDLNRNFMLPEEKFEGFPAAYARLDALLNPACPPSRCDLFKLKALWQIARYGMPSLRQAVAAGQYEFPRGLFYGGSGPARTRQLLEANLARWLQGSREVIHLDFHTGLGSMGALKLLIDYPLNERQRNKLSDWFGANSFEESNTSSIAYQARGGFGKWCVSQNLAPDYLYACVEFGTYHPLRVLAGLRAENQAHHWGNPASASTRRAKQQLKELFCPSTEKWRAQVLQQSRDLIKGVRYRFG